MRVLGVEHAYNYLRGRRVWCLHLIIVAAKIVIA